MIHETYFKELSRALGYLAAWMPNSTLELGDIIDRHTFERQGNISNRQGHRVVFSSRPASTRASFEYSSAGGASIVTKAAGRVFPGSSLAKAEAGLVVKFSRENAIVFEASDCKSSAIDDLEALTKSVAELSAARDWEPEWVVVTEVVRAAFATIIISSGTAAQIDLRATGKIAPVGLRLADPEARFQAASSRDIGYKFIAEAGLTPLYRAKGIKRSQLGEWLRTLASGFRSPTATTGLHLEEVRAAAFAELSVDDFFLSNDS
jgi:hypothetical protein